MRKKIVCCIVAVMISFCVSAEQTHVTVMANEMETRQEINAAKDENEIESEFQKYIIGVINKTGKNVDDSTLWIKKLDILISDYSVISKLDDVNIEKVDEYIERYSSHLENLSIWSLKHVGVIVDSGISEEEIIEKLKENYQNIIDSGYIEKDVLDYYINSYASDTMKIKPVATRAKRVVNQRGVKVAYTYVSSKAVAYARTYGINSNKNFPVWSNADCANFVSQCLNAGGMKMVNDGSATSTNSWYSYGTVANTLNVSSTWRGANMFRWYWIDRAKAAYRLYNSKDVYSKATFGDVISLCNTDGTAYHTMIVVGRDTKSQELILAAHTGNTVSAKLSDKMSAAKCNSVILYKFK